MSLNNLANLYHGTGRFSEAETLYAQALELRRKVLGRNHPNTLVTQLNAVVNRAASGDASAALDLLEEMEVPLLIWLGAEIYSTERTAVRRNFVASQSDYQHVALSLAIQNPDLDRAQSLAATALLRFKGLQAEEEASLSRLVRRGRYAVLGQVAGEVRRLREDLARSFHGGADPEKVADLTQMLDEKELKLGQLSRTYRAQLQVREARLVDLQGTVSGNRTLVDFRRYRPVDFSNWTYGADRWAAVVVRGNARVQVIDLGPVAETAPWVRSLVAENSDADTSAQALYARLIAPLALDPGTTAFISPDDFLNLVPFHRLMPDAQTHWTEVQRLNVVQSGRDLLRLPLDRPAQGLLALGGIDFGGTPRKGRMRGGHQWTIGRADIREHDTDVSRVRAASVFRNGFDPLPGSAAEISVIAAYYGDARPQEPVVVWQGLEATEDRLMSNVSPPRVLHLATHGFYRVPEGRTDRPMLLAGVALASANQALQGNGEDGLLYALEAQDLNLEGTELVVLSACETAQGFIGHGEGVYGLVRALRTAGARHVLVTLRPIGDQSTAEFMKIFHDKWLDQPPDQSEPGKALQETQRHYIQHNPDADWKPFIVIGAP